jgi:hydrogenase maturation protein HypF
VYRLAQELRLTGWVQNDAQGVRLEVEGAPEALHAFGVRLRGELPPRASLEEIRETRCAPEGDSVFEIHTSAAGGPATAVVLADTAPCAACLHEMAEPRDRRYRYPFINCTNCGPRFTIVTALPYDRPHTTMNGFDMCGACRAEYEDPLDRRFHAQPIACPACGPTVRLFDADDVTRARGEDALAPTAELVRGGGILAFKGVGGFLLLCDAASDEAVRRLRARKARESKPLAVLVADVAAARALGEVSPEAATLLSSAEAPIVLLPRRAGAPLADAVAPGVATIGVMLPSSPLHTLLLEAIGRPVVATSGNRSDEPICTDDGEARVRLSGIADRFLGHDRPIARHVDDSVETTVGSVRLPVRRARGRAPLPIRLAAAVPPILAVGGHLKNTIALGFGERVFLSQHIGDLDTVEARAAFEAVIGDFLAMYPVTPTVLAHDLHPDYASTRWVDGLRNSSAARWQALAGVPRVAVQHHHAHLAACLAENGHAGPALGAVWDGTGHGGDGTTWGGEFLRGDARGVRRVAHLRPFSLPGGDAAVHEPRRVAVALLWEARGEAALGALPAGTFTRAEGRVLRRMLETGFQAPRTTSMGRLFDGVAALLGIAAYASHEGQAAMALEAHCDDAVGEAYALPLVADGDGTLVLDWQPLLEELLADRDRGTDARRLAARFHDTLVEALVAVAQHVAEPVVALSGGCFLNRRLLARALQRLDEEGFRVLRHQEVPPGDGGISLGQVAVAAAAQEGD